jgi:tRNA-2-methylthio-N6-dimethylallyladenosine synthase
VLAGGGPQIEVSLDRAAGSRESVARSFESYDPDRDPEMRPTPFQAFIRTQTGCDKFCAFCVVPRVRGPEQARPPAAILAEAKKLVDEGCREITLIGQTVNSYRWADGGRTTRLADLLVGLDAIDGLDRIRFVTNYPRDMTDELIHAVRDLPKVCHYLHVPAQHGSDDVLKRMKRGYTIGEYLEMHGRLMEAIPHAAVTSDFIVGFCGETDDEFQLMLDLVQKLQFKNSFIFKYSPRPGTKAFQRQPDDVPEDVKKARHRLLLDAQTEASLAGNLPLVGSRQQVLVEGLSRRDEKRAAAGEAEAETADGTVQLSGRTMCDRIVVFDAPRRLIGRLVDVDILAAGPWAVSGALARAGSELPQFAAEPEVHTISLPLAGGGNRASESTAADQPQAGHAHHA